MAHLPHAPGAHLHFTSKVEMKVQHSLAMRCSTVDEYRSAVVQLGRQLKHLQPVRPIGRRLSTIIRTPPVFVKWRVLRYPTQCHLTQEICEILHGLAPL
jgi:hypothetical protein